MEPKKIKTIKPSLFQENGVSSHLALLGVELYQISDNFLFKMRESHKKLDELFDRLPEFTINTNKEAKGQPISARYFHQFMGLLEEEKNENYLYFNLKTNDNQLTEEINNCGMDEFFSDFDFRKLLVNFIPYDETGYHNMILPNLNYLVVKLTYIKDYDYHGGGYEFDMDYDIIGYLDGNLQIQYFDGKS